MAGVPNIGGPSTKFCIFGSESFLLKSMKKILLSLLVFCALKAAGYGKLYLVSGEKLIGTDGEATVDYVHQTDLGAMRYAEALYPLLKKLCK